MDTDTTVLLADFENEIQAEDFSALSIEDVKEALELRGTKLGLLLAASNFPDEVKSDIITILPELSLDQIDELQDTLEASYLDEATSDIDEVYKEVVEIVNKNYGTADTH
ncbi:hypothetical protein L0Y69_01005 [bacterium]|nr:hypothetical protein [bacterium]